MDKNTNKNAKEFQQYCLENKIPMFLGVANDQDELEYLTVVPEEVERKPIRNFNEHLRVILGFDKSLYKE